MHVYMNIACVCSFSFRRTNVQTRTVEQTKFVVSVCLLRSECVRARLCLFGNITELKPIKCKREEQCAGPKMFK